MRGIIPASSYIDIDLTFSPTNNITIIRDVEVIQYY